MGDVNYSCLFIICHLFLIMSGVKILQYKLGTFLFISGIMFAFFDSVYYLMIKKKYDFTMVGEVWYYIHPSSLQIIQPAVERYLLVILWDPILLTLGDVFAMMFPMRFYFDFRAILGEDTACKPLPALQWRSPLLHTSSPLALRVLVSPSSPRS